MWHYPECDKNIFNQLVGGRGVSGIKRHKQQFVVAGDWRQNQLTDPSGCFLI